METHTADRRGKFRGTTTWLILTMCLCGIALSTATLDNEAPPQPSKDTTKAAEHAKDAPPLEPSKDTTNGDVEPSTKEDVEPSTKGATPKAAEHAKDAPPLEPSKDTTTAERDVEPSTKEEPSTKGATPKATPKAAEHDPAEHEPSNDTTKDVAGIVVDADIADIDSVSVEAADIADIDYSDGIDAELVGRALGQTGWRALVGQTDAKDAPPLEPSKDTTTAEHDPAEQAAETKVEPSTKGDTTKDVEDVEDDDITGIVVADVDGIGAELFWRALDGLAYGLALELGQTDAMTEPSKDTTAEWAKDPPPPPPKEGDECTKGCTTGCTNGCVIN